MKVLDLPIHQLVDASWNPNQMDTAMLGRLKESITRFGLVSNLVVRLLSRDSYEVLSGNQRLQVLQDLGITQVPCVVVHLDDVSARLLAQALNRIQGEDDLAMKVELIKDILEALPQTEVLQLLPETAAGLQAMAAIGQDTMAEYLQNYQQTQVARLKHLTFQSTPAQLEVIEEALARVMPQAGKTGGDNPNPRGNALFHLCQHYLALIGRES
jgi:ParB family chromosome partitioning protein